MLMTNNYKIGIIDSNILVYAYNRSSLQHKTAATFVEEIIEQHQPYLTSQNVIEFYSTITNPKRVESPLSHMQATSKVAQLVNGGFYKLVNPLPTTLSRLVELLKKITVQSTEIFDLQIAATMLDHGIDTIYTADTKIFTKVGLNAINPLV